MGKAIPRNAPCPCGSGKKYKYCCLEKDRKIKYADKTDVLLTGPDEQKIKRRVTSLDSIPTHNKNGLRPAITTEAMMGLVADEIYQILMKEKVGMLANLVNCVLEQMNIVPTFTYRQIGEWLHKDSRFEDLQLQIFCLAGNDLLKLMQERFQ